MMRKLMIIFISIILCACIFLCSCSIKISKFHSPTEIINLNYNNISTDHGIRLTNDNICYIVGDYFQYYCMETEEDTTVLCGTEGYSAERMEQYGDTIYMLDGLENIDPHNNDFLLKTYDINTKKVENIAVLRNCENFLVLNDIIYYLKYYWSGDNRVFSLHGYSPTMDNKNTICKEVVSFGVIENHLVYVTEEDGIMSIFKYKEEDMSSEKIGEFSIEIKDHERFSDFANFCYTPYYVLIEYSESDNNISTIWKYQFASNEVTQMNLDGEIQEFISYDKSSYFAIFEDESKEVSCIYRLSNDTNEMFKIAQFDGGCRLYVGSDDGVYVTKDTGDMIYCTNEGDISSVYDK